MVMKKKEAEKELNKILEGAKCLGYAEGVSNMLMSSTNNLIEKYASLFGLIIGVEFDYWVGDMRKEDQKAGRPTQPVDVAQYGDYFFNLYDIRVVLDNFEHLALSAHWLRRLSTGMIMPFIARTRARRISTYSTGSTAAPVTLTSERVALMSEQPTKKEANNVGKNLL